MLYLSQGISAADSDISSSNSTPLVAINHVKEDEIDQFLSKYDGLIHRDRDPQL